MPLNVNISEVENPEELWVPSEVVKVCWFVVDKPDPDGGYLVRVGDSYCKATDGEVERAKDLAPAEVVERRWDKHSPWENVRVLPEEANLYQQLYQMDAHTEVLGKMFGTAGIYKITEANAAEVFRRVQVLEELYGALLSGPDGPVLFTEEDIRRRIGLWTNWTFKDDSKAVFTRRINKVKKEREVSMT